MRNTDEEKRKRPIDEFHKRKECCNDAKKPQKDFISGFIGTAYGDAYTAGGYASC